MPAADDRGFAMRMMYLLLVLWLAWAPVFAKERSDAIERAARQIEAAAGSHRLIVLGETHGTRETPRLAAALVQHYAAREPVLLAVEISRAEHAPLRRYLQSPNGHSRTQLRNGMGWTIPVGRNDGRRSEQMLDLVDTLRELRAQGRDVAVLPFDSDHADGDAQARDKRMAAVLRSAYQALPRGRMLVLTGNVHAMRVQAMYCPQCQTPMAHDLLDLDPYAVRIDAQAGQAWTCRDTQCGPHAIGAPAGTEGIQSGADRVYDEEVVLPQFTPATPIRN